MECNRDEALRAKSIAEEKLENKDFSGAKKFALKAKALYAEVDGITQILTTLDVYMSSENKINGETDWYGVLNVSPSADDEAIRKQYRKLALLLHPDKNKSASADGAFKLISEAWSLLSDKAKRLAYNQRRGSGGFQNKFQMPSGPSATSRANDLKKFVNKTATAHRPQNNVSKPQPPPPTQSRMKSNQRNSTFWTFCRRCKMHYEYLKVYLNNTLLCPKCNEAFVATETAPPHDFSKQPNQPRPKQQQQQQHFPHRNHTHTSPSRTNDCVPVKNFPATQTGPPDTNPFGHTQRQQNLYSEKANIGVTDPSIAAKAANVVQQAQERVKRVYNEKHGPVGWEGFDKKTKYKDINTSQHGTNHNTAQGNNTFFVPRSESAPRSNFDWFSGISDRLRINRDLTTAETRTILLTKARKEVLEMLKGTKAEETKPGDKEKNTDRESKRQKRKETPNDGEHDKNKGTEVPTAASMTVPDPDFHDFDQDRSEGSFGDNEVWAAYDDDDGMPRFYALINKVISHSPFKLKISWLNSKTTSEFGSLNWVGSGFYKTCGEFRVGRYEMCSSINAFSQRVSWSKNPRGSVLVLPRKNDVWALYRNWSADWNENTPDNVIHKYEMVIVHDDYNEENGVSVVPLAKMASFKTVFRPDSSLEAVRRIPRDEMFRFSHRVPCHLLTGCEGENVPKGCLELDPAATPLELLQMTTGG